MRLLRLAAVIFALSMMFGEAYRTWGTGRPVYAWLDDQILGLFLILGAWLMSKPTRARFAIFAAGWGFSAGMIYPSFFTKLYDPASSNPGNFDLGVLTLLIGMAFVVTLLGLVVTIRLAAKDA